MGFLCVKCLKIFNNKISHLKVHRRQFRHVVNLDSQSDTTCACFEKVKLCIWINSNPNTCWQENNVMTTMDTT